LLPAITVLILTGTSPGANTFPLAAKDETPRSSAAPAVPLGFSPGSYTRQARWEKRLLENISAARCRKDLRRLTREPHIAGTPGDRRVTDFIFEEFRRAGLNAEIVEYRVLLSYPQKIEVELVEPARVKLANPEPEIPGDPDTRIADPMMRAPWNGYSPSADLTLPVVYANYGRAEDYDELEKRGVSVRGKIVLARYFRGYRGGKSLEAERRGVAGIIVYSDPAEDGAPRGPVYPNGPWGPLGHFQRGAVVYDFNAPGDPLTPGWASTESARRLDESDAKILPKIPMVPLSAADAQEILKRLGGPEAPKDWQGALPLPYRLGGETARVHLVLSMENRVTPIWNVIARIPGAGEPDKLVILGNHHDAWGFGAVDPSSGTASMLELARALGRLSKDGFRPRRTIVLGSWDAEEYTLTGSTEWGEQFADDLRKNAVVCLNVDASASGQDFTVSAVPSLLPAIIEATQAVKDPATGRSVYDRWKEARSERSVRSYAVAGSGAAPVPFGLLGGGSDYMVFLQHNGVPSLDMLFDGPYGVYHSAYDNFRWMERFGDPDFQYHAAMSRLWGLLALRFANAETLPLDYSIYAAEVAAYLESLEKIAPPEFYSSTIRPLIEKCRAWRAVAAVFPIAGLRWTPSESRDRTPPSPAVAAIYDRRDAPSKPPGGDRRSPLQINDRLMLQERALLDERGLPGRPWFRHLIYAPRPSYEAVTLPGLREALETGDLEGARDQAARLGEALDRAIEAAR
jgi:N-acetylated-alpha-linked acidic dipeptidase